MDIYASDEEKGEEIKQWWRDNGISVIAACVLAAAVLWGGRYWLTYQQTQAETASNTYKQVMVLLADGNNVDAEKATQQLLSEFAKTPYAVFAAFEMAKQSVVNDDLATAKTYLEWLIDHAKLPVQVEIARLRLTRLLLNDSQYQQALDIAQQSESSTFESLFAELRGDIYLAQDQQLQAHQAYQNARSTLTQDEARQRLLQLKFDNTTGSQDG